MYKHILVCTDGSELSGKAVRHAIGLARALGAKLTAFYASPEYPTPIVSEGIVLEPISLDEYETRANEQASAILEPVVAAARAAGIDCDSAHLIASSPWVAILETARKVDADVITMASHGRRGLSALLLGSETARVLTHSQLPVIIIR